MKSLIVLLILLGVQIDAQQVYPLNTSALDVPKYSYIKDIEKKFDPYIGKWKWSYGDKEVNIVIIKEEKVLDDTYSIYRDQLIIKYEVKNKNRGVVESTLYKNYFHNREFLIRLWGFNENKLMGVFYGGICGLGRGFVYLGPPNSNRMTWSYKGSVLYLTKDMVDKCPGEVHLPEGEDLVFIKQ